MFLFEERFWVVCLQVAERNLVEMVDHCLLRGDEMEMTDANGSTPLIAAAFHQHLEMVEFLLERSAYPNAARHNGETALHLAAKHGNQKILVALLNCRANMVRRFSKEKKSCV